MKPLLVGQAPSCGSEGRPAFDGRSGYRLASIFGCPLRDVFECVNLLDRWPGKSASGKGDGFPLGEARAAAGRVKAERVAPFSGRCVVLCGANVARAWSAPKGFLYWRGSLEVSGYRLVVIPHPSGMNRWWNKTDNRQAFLAFVLRFYENVLRRPPRDDVRWRTLLKEPGKSPGVELDVPVGQLADDHILHALHFWSPRIVDRTLPRFALICAEADRRGLLDRLEQPKEIAR